MIPQRALALLLTAGVLLAQTPQRVDQQVLRDTMFATLGLGFDGVEAGLKLVDQALKENPKNAEALVWKGVGEFTQAGAAFFEQNQPQGAPLLKAGLDDVIFALC